MNEAVSFQDHIRSLSQDTGFLNEAAQIQAKALLTDLTDRIPQYNWTYVARRVVRNIAAATFELEGLAQAAPTSMDGFSSSARRFALLWEALAKLQESTSREGALLNAAINYELAGYQASAACIAKQIADRRNDEDIVPILEMATRFLRRRFLHLDAFCSLLQLDPATRRLPWEPQGQSFDYVAAMGLAVVANALSEVCKFFLSGSTNSVEAAIGLLADAQTIFAAHGAIIEHNLTRGIASLLRTVQRRATWTLLPHYAPEQPRWTRYLKLLARGPGQDISKSRSISELWPSQVAALEHGLLDSDVSKIIRMPTGAGKTRIAELAIVHTLVQNPGTRCVYIAPYRALVSELEQSFYNLFSDLGYHVSSIVGTYESNEFEELLFREADLFITTPEKLDLLLRSQPDSLGSVRLFVLDEVQILEDEHRGVKYELLVTRLKKSFPQARFIVLSAVVPHQTLTEFAQWFNASPDSDVTQTSWRPTVQRYALLDWSGQTGRLRYESTEDDQLLSRFVPGVIQQKTYEYRNPFTKRFNRPRFPDGSNRSQIASELAFKFAELGPVLIFCPEKRYVDAVAKALRERLDLAIATGETIPPYFRTGETRSASLAREWLGDRDITSWLQSGIGVHFGDLPDHLRNAVETDFRQRNLRILIATSTLAQGVNLPVRTVIMHSCWRWNNDTRTRISARDYWNIAGRAGRAGEETEGLVVHIKVNSSDQVDFVYYSQHKREVEPVRSALYDKLIALTQGRLSEEALKADLDPEILALLVEEAVTPDNLPSFADMLDSSLMKVQADLARRSTESVRRIFRSLASDVITSKLDPLVLRAFSASGLSFSSCMAIYQHIQDNYQEALRLLSTGGPEQLPDMINFFVPICSGLYEMQPVRAFAGSYSELLSRWALGVDIRTLINEFGKQAPSHEELGRFIDEFFGYLLPWSISAYIRIFLACAQMSNAELTEFAASFSVMVKFGVPTPPACWAMSAGIPLRRTAMQMATSFRHEVDDSSYMGFLRWLSTLTAERLQYDLGLTGPLLEDVSRVVLNASANPLMRQLVSIRDFLPKEVEVQGIRYEQRALAAAEAAEGNTVQLERDYENGLDRNAISVRFRGRDLGYIPRDVAQVLAPEIDTGLKLSAVVMRVVHRKVPQIFISVDMR